MKITIVGENHAIDMLGTYPMVSCVKHIKHLIQKNPHEDIEGDIQPSAREDADELRGIIHEIYMHKKKLWEIHVYNSTGYAQLTEPPFHEHFIAVIKQKLPELFGMKFSL
jgi:hypothetical protein